MRYLLPPVIAALAALPLVAQTQPRQIPVVRTWDELRATAVIAAGEFGEARVGIEAVAAPQWAGVLVYCLVSPTDSRKLPSRFNHEHVLGPLDCQISRRGEPRMVRSMANIQTADLPKDAVELLYTRAVAINKQGQFDVEISLRDSKTIIAQRVVIGNAQRGHAWLPCSRGKQIVQEIREADDRKVLTARLSTRVRGIALPAHDGMFPFDWLARNQQHQDNRPLPSLIPKRVSDDLKLSGNHQELMIESETKMIIARPDWHYLARWWINDKPFVPQNIQDHILDQNGMVTAGHRVRIVLDFEPADIDAKSGDKIGLQLLHLPDGWEMVAPELEQLASSPDNKPDLPRLTNRIEFVAP